MFKKIVICFILLSQGINGIFPIASAMHDADDRDQPLITRTSSPANLEPLYDLTIGHANYNFTRGSKASIAAKVTLGLPFVTLCTWGAVEFAGYTLGHAFSKATGAPYYKTREDGSLYIVNIAGHVTDGIAAPLAACKALRILSSFFRNMGTSSLDPNASVLRRIVRAFFSPNPLQKTSKKLKLVRALARLNLFAVAAAPSLMAVLSYEGMDGSLSLDAVALPILLPFFWLFKADPLFSAEEALVRKSLYLSRHDFPCSKKQGQAPLSKAELCQEILKPLDRIKLSSTELSDLMEQLSSENPAAARTALQQLLQKAKLAQVIDLPNRKKGGRILIALAAFLAIPALVVVGGARGDEIVNSLLNQGHPLSAQDGTSIRDTAIILVTIAGVTTQVRAGPSLWHSLANPGDYVHPSFIRAATVYAIVASMWLATEPVWSGIATDDGKGGIIQILILTSFALDYLGKFFVVSARSVQDMRIGMDMVLEGISLFFAHAGDFLSKRLRRSETDSSYVSNHHARWQNHHNNRRFEAMRTFLKTTIPYLPWDTLKALGNIMSIGGENTVEEPA